MSTKIDIKWTIAGILAVVMVFALVLVGSNQQAQAEQSDSLVIPGWLLERIVHIAEVKLGIEEPILGSTRFPNGISADSTAASAGQVRGTTLTITGASTLSGDTTFAGGDGAISVTTTNSATSSVDVGCIEMPATSTDTTIVLTFATEAHSTTTSSGTNSDGLVAWRYGSCPI